MKFLHRTPKCVFNLCFEAMKVLLVCVFLISKTRLFLNITTMINLEQLSILNAFTKILKSARLKMLGMVQKKLYRTTLNQRGCQSYESKSFQTNSRQNHFALIRNLPKIGRRQKTTSSLVTGCAWTNKVIMIGLSLTSLSLTKLLVVLSSEVMLNNRKAN